MAATLFASIGEECWSPSHLLWVFFIGVPMLLLYVIGIPALGECSLSLSLRGRASVCLPHDGHPPLPGLRILWKHRDVLHTDLSTNNSARAVSVKQKYFFM